LYDYLSKCRKNKPLSLKVEVNGGEEEEEEDV